jgi:hypothetical protein
LLPAHDHLTKHRLTERITLGDVPGFSDGRLGGLVVVAA